MPTFSDSTFSRYTGRWLIITAIFELVLAGGFLIGGQNAGPAKSGLMLTGAILGLTGLGLLAFGIVARRRARKVDEIERTGLAGSATLTGMTQTGMYVNENPMIDLHLQVSVPGRAPYEAHHKSVIPLMLLGQLQPGRSFPVKVDREDPQNVVIDWDGSSAQPAWSAAQWPGVTPGAAPWAAGQQQWGTGAAMPLPVSGSSVPSFAPAGSAPAATVGQVTPEQILGSQGVAGTGTVASVQDTGAVIGDTHVISVTMDVAVAGRAPNRVTHVAMVPSGAIGRLTPGKTIPVRTSPENPQLVHVDWGSI